MSNQILLTTPLRVKQMTVLGGTVDDELLYPIILTAQEKYMHPTLGGDLFKKLQTLIDNGTSTDGGNSAYKALLDAFITPCLVQYTFAETVPLLRLRFAHNAVVAMGSEQSTTASVDDIKPVVDSALYIANWHRERMIDHLCYATNLPEYNTQTQPNISPSVTNYTQGLNIGDYKESQEAKIIRQLLDVKK